MKPSALSPILIFICSILISSCAGLGEPDYQRLRNWSGELEASYPKVPFVKKYQAMGKELRYLAAAHDKDPKSKTHILITSQIEEFAPEMVIIEGVESAAGVNPERVLSFLMSSPAQMNEGSYAAKLALEKGALFMGAELTSKEIREHFKYDSNFSLKDLVGFLLLRSMSAFNVSKPDLSLSEAMARVYGYIRTDYGFKEEELLSEVEFLNWAKEALSHDFSYQALTGDDVVAWCADEANRAQKVNCEISKLRSSHLVDVSHEALANYSRVLVVSSAEQLLKIDDALSSFVTSDYLGSYKGILPCADCQGIETEFEISEGNQFKITRHYLGVEDDRSFSGSGKCQLEQNRGVLRCQSEESTGTLFFILSHKRLEVADEQMKGSGSFLIKALKP